MTSGSSSDRRSGLTAVELLVIAAIAAIALGLILISLPQQREAQREILCKANLQQIGQAMAIYEDFWTILPTTAPWPPHNESEDRLVLGPTSLLVSYLAPAGTEPPETAPSRIPSDVPAMPIQTLMCPSDRLIAETSFPAPISYRAVTGGTPDGQGGPFAVGRPIALPTIQEADGVDYTAAYVERLIGTGTNGIDTPRNYLLVDGPIGPNGCQTGRAGLWQGDAGSNWLPRSWRSSLINLSQAPGYQRSCLASDGRTAAFVASSAHLDHLLVLMASGRVETFTRSVSPAIWQGLGTVDSQQGQGDSTEKTPGLDSVAETQP